MNLFDVFPQLKQETTPAIQGRALRLIALSGIVYDDQAFYFELGDERFWGRLPDGDVSIGVGAAKARPDAGNSPVGTVIRHLRQEWRCDVGLFSAGHSFILGEDKEVAVLNEVESAMPYLFILTPPKLGGVEMPDALVQAVYLMRLHRWTGKPRDVSLLGIDRQALGAFLEPEGWSLRELKAQPWAKLHPATALPADARVRPVLALRGFRHLWQSESLSTHLRPQNLDGGKSS